MTFCNKNIKGIVKNHKLNFHNSENTFTDNHSQTKINEYESLTMNLKHDQSFG